MNELEQRQEIVTEIERSFRGTSPTRKLIQNLKDYVDNADFVGVVTNRQVVLDELIASGYKGILDLPVEFRNSLTKANLALCIIGNFISSNGAPPPNVMVRFSDDYLRTE